MKMIKPLLLCILLCGCSIKKEKPSLIRVVNTIPDGNDVKVSIHCQGKEVSVSPAFGSSADYQSLPSGKADIELTARGKTLLHKKVGLGNGEKYTLIFEGLAELSSTPNQNTFNGKIHSIFGGAEASTPNGFLPAFTMLRDNFSAHKDKAKVRVANALAGTQGFDLTLKTDSSSLSLKSGLKYPKKAEPTSVKAGSYQLEIKIKGMPEPLLEKELTLKSCGFYTIVILGSATGDEPLNTLILENDAVRCP